MKSQRKVWVSEELKAQLNAYWRPRTEYASESDLVRSVIEDVIAKGVDEDTLADHDSNGKSSVRVWIEEEEWDAAMTSALASGFSLHSVIRRRLLQLIEGNHEQRPAS